MKKPVSLMVDDFKKSVIKGINESGLPACIIEPILKDIYNQMVNISSQELASDKARYEEAVKEEARKQRVEKTESEVE